ncbi:CoA pyrophosphatase [Pseudomonadota bacterium]
MLDAWRDRLLQAVSPLESGVSGLRVNGYRPPDYSPDEGPFRPKKTAAVLVALLDLPEPEIVFTRRAEHLPQHPGQVSFPGGAAEEGDASAVQTALREAHEEIGLPAGVTTPIGFLDRMDTISDYRVLPVVALVRPPVEWVLDKREVAEVFTVPISIALDESLYETHYFERDGNRYTLWSLKYKDHNIWGATAAMMMNLIVRIRERNVQ